MRTIFQTLQAFKKQLKSSFWWILMISIGVGIIPAFITKSHKTTYEAYSKIFPLSINKAGGGSPLDAIKSQFGVSDKTDYDKIYNISELVKSKRILHQIASSSCTNKKYKLLADWIIDDANTDKLFFEKKLAFNNPGDSIKKIFAAAAIIASNIEVKADKTDFTTIVTKSFDKDLSKELNEVLMLALSNLYISMSTEKPRNDLNKILHLKDSLKDELYAVERAIAGFIDANQLSVKYTNNVPQARLMRTKAEIEQLYLTTSTAYQNARFKLLSESPIFQILDKPGPPYNSYKPSAVQTFITYFALSLFILSFFSVRKIIFEMILQEFKQS